MPFDAPVEGLDLPQDTMVYVALVLLEDHVESPPKPLPGDIHSLSSANRWQALLDPVAATGLADVTAARWAWTLSKRL